VTACPKCQGDGFVCDSCGEARGTWQTCDKCQGDFCAPLRIKCHEFHEHPVSECDGSGVHAIGTDHYTGHHCAEPE
jgi:hypothetical protein